MLGSDGGSEGHQLVSLPPRCEHLLESFLRSVGKRMRKNSGRAPDSAQRGSARVFRKCLASHGGRTKGVPMKRVLCILLGCCFFLPFTKAAQTVPKTNSMVNINAATE